MAKSAPSFVEQHQTDEATLELIRDRLRELRDAKLHLSELEARVKEARAVIHQLERVELPDIFNSAGIDRLGIAPEGNKPGYDAKMKPYYKAVIAESWDGERKAAAYNWLEENGGGDLIKNTIVVRLPKGSRKLQKAVVTALNKLKVDFTVDLSVPWNSLTAFLKESIEKHRQMPPLEKIGADVGRVIKLDERKPD